MFNTLTIDVEGKSLEVDVDYDILPGQPAITDRAPEDCQEGFDDEIIIQDVFIGVTLMPKDMLDLIYEDIAEKLKNEIAFNSIEDDMV